MGFVHFAGFKLIFSLINSNHNRQHFYLDLFIPNILFYIFIIYNFYIYIINLINIIILSIFSYLLLILSYKSLINIIYNTFNLNMN
jgi:hypothetical protein